MRIKLDIILMKSNIILIRLDKKSARRKKKYLYIIMYKKKEIKVRRK